MHKENRRQIKVKAEQAAVKEQKIDCQFMTGRQPSGQR
jgi:hypothetical protein